MNDDLHHLTAAYALDALEPDEAHRFEAHLARCERCRDELAELRATAAALAATTVQAPPEGLRQRVLAQVAATPQEPAEARPAATGHRRRAAAALVAAGVLAVVAAAGLLVRDLAADRDRAEELASVLAAPDARTARLEAVEAGTVRVVWSPSRSGAVVIGSDLPPLRPGHRYELWAFTGDDPRSAGVFEPGSDGDVRRRLELPADAVDAWAVTVEPVDGTPLPEGEVVFSEV